MRLPDFILANIPSILNEWDAFARSIWPVAGPTTTEVRDHAEAILRASARDMQSAQTDFEQSQKSKGLRQTEAAGGDLNNASADHAVDRATVGFDLRAVMAEYRALRASVVRLWIESNPVPTRYDLADLTRFHEAMDQSLAEAVHRYSEHVDKSRNMFIGILGHDLRTPLNAIAIMAQSLAEAGTDDPVTAETASQIFSSTEAIGRMLSDFLDFAVARLGRPMPVTPTPMDLTDLCREVVTEVRASCPAGRFQVNSAPELRGKWDRPRMRQLLSNLINNAVQHGDTTAAIEVSVKQEGGQVTLRVHNEGTPIPAEHLPYVFDPHVRAANSGERDGSVGLGLYIARQVAVAHGGTIEVDSTPADGTTFTVRLPLYSASAS